MLAKKPILAIVSLIMFILTPSLTADVAEDAKAIDISGGENHTLVLTKNKFPWACGDNSSYQLGIGNDTTAQKTLQHVKAGDMNTPSGYLEDIEDIDAGWQHSLALDVNGLVWAWGNNGSGQLGDGGENWYETTPAQVHGLNNVGYLENIIGISAGRSGAHSLAVDANNFAYGWGLNSSGQLGNGDSPNNRLTPVKVHDGEMNTGSGYLENIIAVSAGEWNSMALDANGFVWTWGSNRWPGSGTYPGGYGKLGNGNTVDFIDTPVQVLSGEQESSSDYLQNIVVISAGWDHCMAIEDIYPADPNRQGRVYTWGNNGQGYDSDGGRLGDGTTEDSNVPVMVLAGEQNPGDPNSPLKILSLSQQEKVTAWRWGTMAPSMAGAIITTASSATAKAALVKKNLLP